MQAKFYDGRTANKYFVQIDILSDRIAFRRAETTGPYEWFFRDVEAEKITNNLVILRNRLIPDARLEVEGGNVGETLKRKLRFRANVMWTEDTKVLTAIVVAFLVAAFSLFWMLDDLAEAAVVYLPRKMEKQIFGDVETMFAGQICDQTQFVPLLAKISDKLLEESEKSEIRILVVENDQVNAFALPGGTIILHTGLIKEVLHSDEISGVLAHEMEHQSQRHIAKSMIKKSIVSIVSSLVVGGQVGDVTKLLTGLKFSREAEASADAGAAIRLDRAGISRMGMVHFLRRLSQKAVVPEILSTHPLEGREKQLLDGYDITKKYPSSLSDGEFRKLKAIRCIK